MGVAPRQPSLLLFGSQMETGGAQKVLLSQAAWFQAHGYRVDIVFLYDKENLKAHWEAETGMTVIDLQARDRKAGRFRNVIYFLRGLIRGMRLLASGHYDIVETFGHHASLAGIPLAWAAGVPARVATHHGRILNFPKLLNGLHNQIVNNGMASCLVAVSEKVKAAAVEDGVRPEKIVIISNGIDLPTRSLNPDEIQQIRQKVRSEFRIADTASLVLNAGRMTHQKGQEVLIRAFAQVSKHCPDTALLIAGDGPLRQDLTQEASNLGIAGQVHMPGIRRDLPDLMAAADIFAISSNWEGLPMVLLEAINAGLPVVSTRVEGVEQVIVDGQTGLLVPVNNPIALGNALVLLLENEPERRQIAAAARQRVETDFSLEKMCSHYAKLFDRLANQSKPSKHSHGNDSIV